MNTTSEYPEPPVGKSSSSWKDVVPQNTSKISRLGFAIIILFFGVGGLWSIIAPLSGAVIAGGVVAAAGQNINLQHLEGGIIRQIHVAEGDRVNLGDPLIELDPVKSSAMLSRLENQRFGMKVRALRLEAERDLRPDLGAVIETEDASKRTIFEEQKSEFKARFERFALERSILEQRVGAIEEGMKGLKGQLVATDKHIKVVAQEVSRKGKLLKKGLTNRSEYTDLLRSQADLIGRRSQLVSQIASSRVQLVEAREQIERSTSQRIETAITALNDLRVNQADIEEQINAARDVVERTVVRSPTNGIIVQLKHNVAGSVVRPGDMMIELLPTNQRLVVEARIQVQDRDEIAIEQNVKMAFASLDRRTTPEVGGKVQYISADRLTDERSQEPYYLARVRITDSLPDAINPSDITPGMPVDLFFLGQPRTLAEYLLKPITDSFGKAFRQ